MTSRKHKIDEDAPVLITITITGPDLDTALMGLTDIEGQLHSGKTSGEVAPGTREGYTYAVHQLAPATLTPAQQEDLDLVECTPHAFRGEKWVRASVRLDRAGIKYAPGSRYNGPTKAAPVPGLKG